MGVSPMYQRAHGRDALATLELLRVHLLDSFPLGFDVGGRELGVGPPVWELGVDPDVFIRMLQRELAGRLPGGGLEDVLGEVGEVPALFVGIVVEPEAEAYADD